MDCPLTPEWLKSRGKNNRNKPVLPNTSHEQSTPHHCPIHDTKIVFNEEKETKSSCSGVCCCFSGCCYTKRHSRTNEVLRKLSQRNLCQDMESVPLSTEYSTETWCQRRTRYQKLRLKISEATTDHILKKLSRKDLELLLSALEQNPTKELQVGNYSKKVYPSR